MRHPNWRLVRLSNIELAADPPLDQDTTIDDRLLAIFADHGSRHVVNREECRSSGAALSELLHDEAGIKP